MNGMHLLAMLLSQLPCHVGNSDENPWTTLTRPWGLEERARVGDYRCQIITRWRRKDPGL